jgi:uncharacterized protein YndB with AHSA1/START domain
MPGKVELHRVFAAPPERVYRAFVDPDALTKWMPPYGFYAKVHHYDFRVGGSYKMSFTNFSTKSEQAFGGTYLEIKPNEYLKYNDKFEGSQLPGEMLNTVRFRKVVCGTEVWITQEGIPDAIPAEMCYLGWQQCLNQLALLVEPEIPDGV